MKTIFGAALVAAMLGGPLAAQDATKAASDKVDLSIKRAIDYLVSVQDKDGAITEGNYNHTAMSSLAIMAMAAVGHQPSDETPQGAAMKKALSFVLRPDRQEVQGYFGGRDGSRMYGHGITTLMLSEMLGMGVDAQMDQVLRDRCRLAVELIKRSQSFEKDPRNRGGWRYAPESRDSDLSITVAGHGAPQRAQRGDGRAQGDDRQRGRVHQALLPVETGPGREA